MSIYFEDHVTNKHAVIYLNYRGRSYDMLFENGRTAGIQISYLYIIDREGIAKAINEGLRQLRDYDTVTILGNDILEPQDWLLMRTQFAQSFGVCSFQVGEPAAMIQNTDIIGNYTITRQVIDKVGAFNEHFDPYGAIDLDYCHRARAAGFQTSYIPGHASQHIGLHGQGGEYGYNKSDMVQKTWQDHVNWSDQYRGGQRSYYIPLINEL